jgi:hypothetical protein
MVNDYGCSALDFSPGGTLYAGGLDSSGVVSLFTVNTATGVATKVGVSNQGSCSNSLAGSNISDLSFSTSGALFALFVTVGAGGAGNPCLGTLSTSTGAETNVGLTGMTQAGDGLATAASNVLYGADLFNLYTLSRTTGAATVLAPLSGGGGMNGNGVCSATGLPPNPLFPNGLPPAHPVDAMKFNNGGILYAVINCGRGFVAGDSFLATIATSGVITDIHETVGGTGASIGIDGIAWGPQIVHPPGVPEFPLGGLGSLALVAAALPILWMLRGKSAARLA